MWSELLNFSNLTEQYIITFLTALAVIFNIAVGIRAVAMAMALDSGCVWVCRSVGIQRVANTLHAMATICLILAMLKTWSVFDIFLKEWYMMSNTYHVRSFIYLAENFGVPMTFYAVITLIKNMLECKTARDLHSGKMIMISNGDKS